VARLSVDLPPGPIYLVRHGETEWNVDGRFQGQLDSPLTARGRAEAYTVGRILAAHLGASKIPLHVSPLGRARETASLLRSRFDGPEPVQDARLQEVTVGAWDGLNMIEIHAEWPNALDGASPFDWYFRSPDGESYEAASARLSHGLAGRLIRGAYLGLAREDALHLPVPEGVVHKLAGGAIETLTLSPAAC
jgi:broad specificity phosphatase PhoE